MKMKLLFILALSWILVGCSPAMVVADKDPLEGCQTQPKQPCKGNPQAPTVNVNTKSKKLMARPYCAKAKPGTQLVIRLTPAGNKALKTVEIIPKDSNHSWLKARNDDFQNLIIIDVPKELAEGDYYYGIKTDTKCLDPRIRVVN